MSNEDQLEAQFWEFHRNNPDVYEHLVTLARKATARGKTRIGMKMLWEVLRWEKTIAIEGDTEYKLNNNYHSRYARLIMDTEPDLAGIFETRRLKTSRETEESEEPALGSDPYDPFNLG